MNLTQVFGGTSNRGLASPLEMTFGFCASTAVMGQSSTTLNASGDDFWAALGNRNGAYAALTQADTYTTVANVTSGSGYFFYVLSNTVEGAGASVTQSIKVTIDGTAYEVADSCADATNDIRFVLGAPPVDSASSYADYPMWPRQANTYMSSANWDTFPSAAIPVASTIAAPQACLALGLYVRFETSLKVECKVSVLPTDTLNQRNAGAVYWLDASNAAV